MFYDRNLVAFQYVFWEHFSCTVMESKEERNINIYLKTMLFILKDYFFNTQNS